jgi:hypothetical protein
MFKNTIIGLLGVSFILILAGCSRYSFVETSDGQSIFLDEYTGKVIYVDSSNRAIDRVDLTVRTVNQDGTDKSNAMNGHDWGVRDVPGEDYKITFSSRFYNNKLLYKIDVTPNDRNILSFARTVSIKLMDQNGYVLETIESIRYWNHMVDNDGEEIGVNTWGEIPITLGNYLEIKGWSATWQGDY